jgi:hypothetical protein
MRRICRRNKQNARKAERIGSRARDGEVGVMDRIESSAKDRQTRNNYSFTMVTVLILTSFLGRSEESLGVLAIFSTIS